VSSRIPGSMKIGEIESVGLARSVANDVEFFTPAGQRVLRVDRAEAQLDLARLFRGTIALHNARADGGQVVLEIAESGRTNVENAFKQEREHKPRLDLKSMHFQNMSVVLRMSGETRFLIHDLQGFLSVWRQDTPNVRVSLGRIRGTFEEPKITGDKIELLNMEGQVWAKEHHVVSMVFNTRIGNGRINAYFDYYNREENAAMLKLQPETGSGARLATMAIEVRSWFSDKLNVTVEN